jgi:3-methyl-2-oxobutanoate hydroxymethyltransferase
MRKTSICAFAKRYAAGEKLVMITCGDAPGAAAAAAAGVDILLVGDSLGMTMLGYNSTIPVTMQEMLHHAKAVRRGAPEAFVVCDMPFMSYQISDEEALRNAAAAIKEAAADAVKIEGGANRVSLVRKLVSAGIPVMAHIGLLPQHIQAVGAYKVVGRAEDEAKQLMEDAAALQDAGAFAIVLECVPAALAAKLTAQVNIPTIGIGSGPDCSGQVQVMNDILGIFEHTPKHAKRYAEIGRITREAIAAYAKDVAEGVFPASDNSFK